MADKPDGSETNVSLQKGESIALGGSGGGVEKASASEYFLRQGFEEAGLKHHWPFIIVGVLFHVALAFVVFPEYEYDPKAPTREKKVVYVRKYQPPPPKIERKKIREQQLKRKMPVPDPTPEEPEPIIEPEPEPIPEDIPLDVPVLIGEPEPPPVTGPLMAGVDGVTNPVLIPETKVQPEYPEIARRARVQGSVILRAVIHKDGSVGDIEVLSEPGAKEGIDYGFGEKAIAAVSQWRYNPGTQNGRPVDTYFTVRVRFTLQ